MEPENEKVANPIVRIINTIAAHIAPSLNSGDKDNLAADLKAFNDFVDAKEAEAAADAEPAKDAETDETAKDGE